ncbi:MAG: type II toxin-antitoxin system HicB family antitoxin [Gammaproteobacteria bacterium]|nr:type II toxin-antitoxin system HicB family antitoxin [Gammaproteobacteria bacterium]
MNFTTVVDHCKETGLYVGYVPGFTGAHSQGKTLDELSKNLQKVIAMLLEDGKKQRIVMNTVSK